MTRSVKMLTSYGAALGAVIALAACQVGSPENVGTKSEALATATAMATDSPYPSCTDGFGNSSAGCTSDNGSAPEYHADDSKVVHNCPSGSAYAAQNRDCAPIPSAPAWDSAIPAGTQPKIASALNQYLAGLSARDLDATAATMDSAAVSAAFTNAAAADGVELRGFGPVDAQAMTRAAAAAVIGALPSETPTTFIRRVDATARADVWSAVVGWTANVGFIRNQYDYYQQPGTWVAGATGADAPEVYATAEVRMVQHQIAVVLGGDGVFRIATQNVAGANIAPSADEGTTYAANVLAGQPPSKTEDVWAAENGPAYADQPAPTTTTTTTTTTTATATAPAPTAMTTSTASPYATGAATAAP